MILITGGLGYIGANICVDMLNHDHEIIVIDNLSNSNEATIKTIEKLTGKTFTFYDMDIRNYSLNYVFLNHEITNVIHLAGLKVVSDSIKIPKTYYDNNVTGTLNLLNIMNIYNCKNIIFSSSASVYGNTDLNSYPITEEGIVGMDLTNPYAKTKYMVEEILKDYYNADNSWSIVILRYFNPIGADSTGSLGDSCKTPTNIFPRIMNSACSSRDRSPFYIYGDDYDTDDGTCERDYIHVCDLAQVHTIVLNKLQEPGISIYNVGTNSKTSVMELINKFEQVNNVKINYKIADRRDGDLVSVYTCSDKLLKEFNWKPKYDLEDMCKHGWKYKLNDQSGDHV